jgi:hypothetical protein
MSHDHVVLVGFSIQLMGVLVLGVVLGRMLREMQREARQFARVLGALIVQESDKIQALLREDGAP